jgi:hypothetical protein
MAFDKSIGYSGDVEERDEATANLLNARLLQISSTANRPSAGNTGVMHWSTDSLRFSYDNGSTWAEFVLV